MLNPEGRLRIDRLAGGLSDTDCRRKTNRIVRVVVDPGDV